MTKFIASRSLRIRYVVGLLMIALLVTASYVTMQRIVAEQSNFARIINLAGHQAGLSNRIAYFAGLMATTEDPTDFSMAKAQVGRTIHKMEQAHKVLREGDAELGIPMLTNQNLQLIYEDPMVGLDMAVQRYIERARAVYEKPMDELSTGSVAFIFLTTYGPHVLEPMFDAVVEEYQRIADASIDRIQDMELLIWLSALAMLALEAALIFRPLERRIAGTMKQLQDERGFLQHVIDGVDDPILVTDHGHKVLRTNRAARQLAQGSGTPVDGLLVCRRANGQADGGCGCVENACVRQAVWDKGETRRLLRSHRDPDGEERTIEVSMSPLSDDAGRVVGVIEAHRDISEHLRLMRQLKASESSYAHLAQHDALTGLPNRILFNDRLGQALHEAHRQDASLAVLFVDLDEFKLVNDGYDHGFGDEVLKAVADRIRRVMRENDTLARMGGDEFTIILRDLTHAEAAGVVAQKILALFEQPFAIKRQTIFLGASIGISVYPRHGEQADDLVRKADTAMYRAKDEGKNTFRYYSKGMTLKAMQRITLETQIRRALKEREFELHYQPQIQFSSGRVSGLEALVRWRTPDGDMMPPGQFIPTAEESGLIVELGEWILFEACRQMRQWLDERVVAADVLMCVNISAKQFDKDGLVNLVDRALRDTHLPAANLELEITESTMMRSPGTTRRVLRQLRDIGVQVAIDDFGTGYSSLSHLKLLPLTKLKIDKSFVSDIPGDANDAAIARAIILLGRSLALDTLAEGIETAEQLAFLRREGCGAGQGYLFAKPMTADALAAYLTPGEGGDERALTLVAP
jgi:diguanylate cyclase (GGDEF)-like protein